MPSDYGARGRQYSAPRHKFSRSPSRADGAPGRHNDLLPGRGKDTKPSSSYDKRDEKSPPSRIRDGYNAKPLIHAKSAQSSLRTASGSGPAPARSHFQNLSWTPDKGSRGGVIPTERRLPPRQGPNEKSSNTNGSDQSLSKAADKTSKSTDTGRASSPREAATRSDKSALASVGTSQAQEERPKEDRKPSTSAAKPLAAKPPVTKPPVKFEMKVPTAPALARRSNPIQTAPKAPSRPSVFQTASGSNDDRFRRPHPPSPHTKPPPPRFSHSRYDDDPAPRRSSYADDYHHDNTSYRSDYNDPYPPPRDRRPQDNRIIDSRQRSAPVPRVAKSMKSSKPRRKRYKKVLKKHVRVVLPPRSLPQRFAASDFVYHPRPDRTSVVGAGTYGKVFKAHNVYLDHCVALKTLPLIKPRRKATPRDHTSRDKKRKRQDRWVKDGLHLTSLREIKLLKSISHQHANVAGIREIFLEGPSCNLVFDYFEFDMHGIIYSAKVALEDAMTKDLVRQVFCGLDFLHTKAHILHRDIKAANILVGVNGQVRIADFGLAKYVKGSAHLDERPWYKKKFEHSNRVITTPYRSPELLLGATLYGGEVDVWSAGCVLFEAFLKKLPFQGTGEDVDHLLTIWKVLGLPNPNTYPDVTELEWYWLFISRVQPKRPIFGRLYKDKMTSQLYHLLRCIFQHDPTKRPTSAQILKHPFFTSESPLPRSAGPFLQTVEGEWHELEYKMIRDKEKAATRRKHEDKVILGYLHHKQLDHEQELSTSIAATDITSHQERIAFYRSEQKAFKQRLDAKMVDNEDETNDQTKQVAEMKKTHGDMYMNAARRGRYRGPTREKVDEKLLQEAWKWYEEETKKGNNPIQTMTSATMTGDKSSSSRPTPTKVASGAKNLLKNALHGSVTASNPTNLPETTRAQRKANHEARVLKHARQLTRYQDRKAAASSAHKRSHEKRSAASPLVDDRGSKKFRDDRG